MYKTINRTSLVAQMVKNLPAMQKSQVRFLGQEDALKKGMATHSNVYPCLMNSMDRGVYGLQSMGVSKSRTQLSN